MITELTRELLDHCYQEKKRYFEVYCNYEPNNYDKFAFLTDVIFNLTTYDSDIDKKWGEVIFDVMCAIRDSENNLWMYDDEKYNQFLLVCQLLNDKKWINWGTSIRSCWFENVNYVDRKLGVFGTLCICDLSFEDKYYDEEGVGYTKNNLLTLLEWVEE